MDVGRDFVAVLKRRVSVWRFRSVLVRVRCHDPSAFVWYLGDSSEEVLSSAHTICEIIGARWGATAHKVFLFFCFLTNIIVSSMLILGGAATVNALTGMDIYAAGFLIPMGVIVYHDGGFEGDVYGVVLAHRDHLRSVGYVLVHRVCLG